MLAHRCTLERPFAGWQVVAVLQCEEWVQKMSGLSLPAWQDLTAAQRIDLCGEYAREAELLARAANPDRKTQYERLASEWRQIAAELEQFGAPKSALPGSVGGQSDIGRRKARDER